MGFWARTGLGVALMVGGVAGLAYCIVELASIDPGLPPAGEATLSNPVPFGSSPPAPAKVVPPKGD